MIDSIHEFLLVSPLKYYASHHETVKSHKTVQNFQKKKVGCIRIDGGTPAASRQQLVTEFQEKDSIKAAVVW